MTTLKVPDMHCEKCVARITDALNEAKIDFTIDLATKTVCVDSEKVEAASSELDDLGFEASAE